MQIDDLPPLEKVLEVVQAVDPGMQITNVDGVYAREIEGKWYAYVTRPQQHVRDPETGEVGPPYATVVIEPSNPALTEGDVLGVFASHAATLMRHIEKQVAIADAEIEP